MDMLVSTAPLDHVADFPAIPPGWQVVRDGGPVARDGFIALAQLRPYIT